MLKFPVLLSRWPVSSIIHRRVIYTVGVLEEVRLLNCSLNLVEIGTLFDFSNIFFGSFLNICTFASLLRSCSISSRWCLLVRWLQILHWCELLALSHLAGHRALLASCILSWAALILGVLTLLNIDPYHMTFVVLQILMDLILTNAVKINLARVVCLISSSWDHRVTMRSIQWYGALTWFFRVLVNRSTLLSHFLLFYVSKSQSFSDCYGYAKWVEFWVEVLLVDFKTFRLLFFNVL